VVLFFIELSTRRVEIAGISAAANGLWMSQIARNLTDCVEGLLTGKRYLIHDRDPLFTDEFLRTLKVANVESVKLPARSPNQPHRKLARRCSTPDSERNALARRGHGAAMGKLRRGY